MSALFVILRRGTDGSYSTRGPVAVAMTLKAAREEIVHLKRQWPYQDFVLMGEVGTVERSERVAVKLTAPDIGTHKRRRAKTGNVVPLKAQGNG